MVELLSLYSNHSEQGREIARWLDLPVRAECKEARRPRSHKRLSDERTAELVAAYQAGATVYELSERFGIPRDRVSRLVKAAGVHVRDHQRVDVDLARAAELAAQGMNVNQVAKAMGIGRTTLIKARRAARAVATKSEVQG